MSKLDEAIQSVLDNIEEEYRVVDSLQQTYQSLINQQKKRLGKWR